MKRTNFCADPTAARGFIRKSARQLVFLAAISVAAVVAFADSATNGPVYRGRSLDSWLDDLEQPGLRIEAATAISNMDPPVAPVLVDRLVHSTGKAQGLAAQALMAIGPAAMPAMPALAAMLTDPSSRTAETAIVILSRIGTNAAPFFIDALKKWPDEHSPSMELRREKVVATLSRMGPAVRDAIPLFLKYLTNGTPDVRSCAVDGLSAVAYENPTVTAALIKTLKDPDEPTRRNAAYALGFSRDARIAYRRESRAPNFNPFDKSGAPAADPGVLAALRQMAARDSEYKSREAATYSLMRLDAKGTLAELLQNLASPDAELRRNSARNLALFKKGATNAIPALIKCLSDDDNGVKQSAAIALREIGEQPVTVVPALMKGLSDADLETQVTSGIALGVYGPLAKQAVPKIIDLLKKPMTPLDNDDLFNALYKIDSDAADRVQEEREKDAAPVEMKTPIDLNGPNELR